MARERSAAFRGIAREQSGVAMLEAALVLPALLLLVAGIVMVGRVAQAQIAVQAVVREAGRTVAAAPSEHEGLASAHERARAVAAGHGLLAERLELAIDAGGFERGGTVRVEASYPVALGDLPLLGRLEVTVAGSHQERIELYRSRWAGAP